MTVIVGKMLYNKELFYYFLVIFICKNKILFNVTNLQVIMAPGLVSNIQQYNGILFQVVYEVKKKKKTIVDVLAEGGRYDGLLAKFRKPGRISSIPQFAVGVNIAFDKVLIAWTVCYLANIY